MPPLPLPSPRPQQTMQCMEVWGGSEFVDTSVTVPGLDAWLYSKPYGDAAEGGDVHYLSSCATGRVTRLLVADVSGHGAKVCDVAGSLRSLMRRYVNFIDQGAFVRSMNDRFVTMSADACFATAIVTTFFAPTNSLSLCNAGHPPPLLYRAKTQTWEYLELRGRKRLARFEEEIENEYDDADDDAPVTNIPLGVQELADYEQFEVTLGEDDLVLCYTDSLIEARDADRELLGLEGLLGVVRTLDVSTPATLIPSLLTAIASRNPGNLDADDVTAMLFRPTTNKGFMPSLRYRLLAPVRVLNGMARAVKSGTFPGPLPEFTIANIGGYLIAPLNRLRRRSPNP